MSVSGQSVQHVATSAVAGLLGAAMLAVSAYGEIAFEPTWKAPAYGDLRRDVLDWMDDANLPADISEKIDRLWPEELDQHGDELELLDRLAETFAAADPHAADLARVCRADYNGPTVPDAAWLAAAEVPSLVRNNLRLYYARWLAQHGLYDEVLETLADLKPADVADPASLLFYRMASHHQLVQPDEARAALVQLMERKDALPRRFHQVAELVERDLAALEDESLDHIARRMNDIRRRLAYGRAGQRVQAIERGVVESLDRKIDQLEEQQRQQQQAAQSQSSGQIQPSTPMQDSRLAPMQAPMQVDQRDIGHKSGWGNLPPKEREQALQQIGRDFPAHYRDLIEQYFRELAAESPSEN
jgi:hypothetical protein